MSERHGSRSPRGGSCRRRAALAPLALCAACLVACAGGEDGSSDGSGDTTGADAPRILGRISEASSGLPVRDAVVRTEPPTETVTTDIDGEYELIDSLGDGGRYEVSASRLGYETAQTRVSVVRGGVARADLQLRDDARGLVVGVTDLRFGPGVSRLTFPLSSTLPDRAYDISVADPWITVTPSQGTIVNGETVFVAVAVDRTRLPTEAVATGTLESRLAINSTTDARTIPIDLLIDVETRAGQRDCRRVDVLRVGRDDPDEPLVSFGASARLPGEEGPRFFASDRDRIADSLLLREPGTVTIAHVAGGPLESEMELFELGEDDRLRVRARSVDGGDVTNRRARVSVELEPGVYCYILGAEGAGFSPDDDFSTLTRVHVDLDFRR